jgi:predicted RNA-binding protein with TRAM domain
VAIVGGATVPPEAFGFTFWPAEKGDAVKICITSVIQTFSKIAVAIRSAFATLPHG